MAEWKIVQRGEHIMSLFLLKEDGESICMLDEKRYICNCGLLDNKSNFVKVRELDHSYSLYYWNGKEFVKVLQGDEMDCSAGLVNGESDFVIAEIYGTLKTLYRWDGEKLVKV